MRPAAVLRTVAFAAAFAIGTISVEAPVIAASPDETTYVAPLADPVLEARAKALQKELRCLVCQGQSIDPTHRSPPICAG
jgi:cytochrome c-type biogenesis protein CcmH